MSLTKKPMKPMTAKPMATDLQMPTYSFCDGLVHRFTKWVPSYSSPSVTRASDTSREGVNLDEGFGDAGKLVELIHGGAGTVACTVKPGVIWPCLGTLKVSRYGRLHSRNDFSQLCVQEMTTAEASPIQTLYCLCGEFCVVLEKSLDALPRRPSDNAFVLRNKVANGKPKTTYRWNARPDKKPVLIKRDTGIERIFRFRCTRCDLPIGYETSDPAYVEMKGEKYRDTYTYLLDVRSG
jgi:hypothetical protein